VRIVTLPGVFRPRSDSRLLAEVLCAQTLAPGARVLDLCSGSGIVAVAAAVRRGADATAIDVSRRAVLTARLNGRLNGVRVRARRGDLLGAVAGERFDAIVSNPPYLPAEDDELPASGPVAGLGGRPRRSRAARPDRRGRAGPPQAGRVRPARALRGLRDGAHARGPARRGVSRPRSSRARGGRWARCSAPARISWSSAGCSRPGQTEEDVVVIRGRAPRTAQAAPGARAQPGIPSGAAG
jgi:release factor glutamine methyltransferase